MTITDKQLNVGYKIPGNLLATIFDESNCDSQENSNGFLFGARNEEHICSISDSEEGLQSIERSIVITSFIHYRNHLSFKALNKKEITMINNNNVGILVIRKDGLTNPSFFDVMKAREMSHDHVDSKFPYLILVISVPNMQNSWIFGMNFNLFAISNKTRELEKVELSVISYSSTTYSTDFIHNTSTSLQIYNNKLNHQFSSPVAVSVHGNVELELMASKIIEEIKLESSKLISLEEDVKELRELLHRKKLQTVL